MPRTRLSRTLRLAGVTAALGASLTLTGCGFDAQTLQTYTPAQGINVDVAGGPKVRNLLLIANASGKGQVSASIVAPTTPDRLAAVAATPIKPDSTLGAPLTVSAANVPLPAGTLVVLTDAAVAPIIVTGSDLKPGLTAQVTLTFASGAVQQVVVPVMDATNPIYVTAAPSLR
jgi:hypothetical protein